MLFFLLLGSLPAAAALFWLGYRTGLVTRIEIAPNARTMPADPQKVTR